MSYRNVLVLSVGLVAVAVGAAWAEEPFAVGVCTHFSQGKGHVQMNLEMIKAAGLPYGDVPNMLRTTAACACACTDANLIGPARAFAEMLLDLNYDDALVDVCRSLAIPRQ